jgi:hypothetical protein
MDSTIVCSGSGDYTVDDLTHSLKQKNFGKFVVNYLRDTQYSPSIYDIEGLGRQKNSWKDTPPPPSVVGEILQLYSNKAVRKMYPSIHSVSASYISMLYTGATNITLAFVVCGKSYYIPYVIVKGKEVLSKLTFSHKRKISSDVEEECFNIIDILNDINIYEALIFVHDIHDVDISHTTDEECIEYSSEISRLRNIIAIRMNSISKKCPITEFSSNTEVIDHVVYKLYNSKKSTDSVHDIKKKNRFINAVREIRENSSQHLETLVLGLITKSMEIFESRIITEDIKKKGASIATTASRAVSYLYKIIEEHDEEIKNIIIKRNNEILNLIMPSNVDEPLRNIKKNSWTSYNRTHNHTYMKKRALEEDIDFDSLTPYDKMRFSVSEFIKDKPDAILNIPTSIPSIPDKFPTQVVDVLETLIEALFKRIKCKWSEILHEYRHLRFSTEYSNLLPKKIIEPYSLQQNMIDCVLKDESSLINVTAPVGTGKTECTAGIVWALKYLSQATKVKHDVIYVCSVIAVREAIKDLLKSAGLVVAIGAVVNGKVRESLYRDEEKIMEALSLRECNWSQYEPAKKTVNDIRNIKQKLIEIQNKSIEIQDNRREAMIKKNFINEKPIRDHICNMLNDIKIFINNMKTDKTSGVYEYSRGISDVDRLSKELISMMNDINDGKYIHSKIDTLIHDTKHSDKYVSRCIINKFIDNTIRRGAYVWRTNYINVSDHIDVWVVDAITAISMYKRIKGSKNNKSIVIIDEPTYGADSNTREGRERMEVLGALLNIKPWKVMLISATNPQLKRIEMKGIIDSYTNKFYKKPNIYEITTDEVQVGIELLDNDGCVYLPHYGSTTCDELKIRIKKVSQPGLMRLYDDLYWIYTLMDKYKVPLPFNIEDKSKEILSHPETRHSYVFNAVIELFNALISTNNNELVREVCSEKLFRKHSTGVPYTSTIENLFSESSLFTSNSTLKCSNDSLIFVASEAPISISRKAFAYLMKKASYAINKIRDSSDYDNILLDAHKFPCKYISNTHKYLYILIGIISGDISMSDDPIDVKEEDDVDMKKTHISINTLPMPEFKTLLSYVNDEIVEYMNNLFENTMTKKELIKYLFADIFNFYLDWASIITSQYNVAREDYNNRLNIFMNRTSKTSSIHNDEDEKFTKREKSSHDIKPSNKEFDEWAKSNPEPMFPIPKILHGIPIHFEKSPDYCSNIFMDHSVPSWIVLLDHCGVATYDKHFCDKWLSTVRNNAVNNNYSFVITDDSLAYGVNFNIRHIFISDGFSKSHFLGTCIQMMGRCGRRGKGEPSAFAHGNGLVYKIKDFFENSTSIDPMNDEGTAIISGINRHRYKISLAKTREFVISRGSYSLEVITNTSSIVAVSSNVAVSNSSDDEDYMLKLDKIMFELNKLRS